MMGVSNRDGSLVLTTGNKSELAVGYRALYGDMNSALAVIPDVPKVLRNPALLFHAVTLKFPK
jgi:NAD+ synthase (glutamine-hydrolysing)